MYSFKTNGWYCVSIPTVSMPVNYYPDNDDTQKPLLQWRSHGNILYSNWLNYYVYQEVPYEFINNREIIGK